MSEPKIPTPSEFREYYFPTNNIFEHPRSTRRYGQAHGWNLVFTLMALAVVVWSRGRRRGQDSLLLIAIYESCLVGGIGALLLAEHSPTIATMWVWRIADYAMVHGKITIRSLSV